MGTYRLAFALVIPNSFHQLVLMLCFITEGAYMMFLTGLGHQIVKVHIIAVG